jgi:malonyl CoA-acyl carrier protein transacylase
MNSIAIIGLSCRLPKAQDPESFWHLLKNGVDAISEVPASRWPVEQFYDPNPATPGKMNTRFGGFIENVERFDGEFFKISAREAERIDPQHRLLLELTWKALENAAIIPQSLAGTRTGVFVGIGNSDYNRLINRDVDDLNAYNGVGTALGLAANRISYFLDLKGPSMSIDTACSSSAVALHLACQSLQSVETNLCIVGGVNLILSPEVTIAFSQARMMSGDGRCKTFDATANGYVRGEGCGVIILKRLEDAQRDGDRIESVIRGIAINQDGLTNGITAPNGLSQQAVIRQALEKAALKPADISYIEAHGTGTALGDPIEVNALKAVFMKDRPLTHPCWLTSVKTNIGHLETASGITSVIKVTLALKNRQIPPHLHFQKLNPYISLEDTSFQIPTQLESWSNSLGPLRAGISSFSFGGTNVHTILEEAPNCSVEKSLESFSWQLLTLSAQQEETLSDLVQNYVTHLETYPEQSLSDICATANRGRTHFAHRLAITASSTQELQAKLRAYNSSQETVGVFRDTVARANTPKIAFLFTGQGSQYLGMGKQLDESEPIFRQYLDRCDEILRPLLNRSLRDLLLHSSPEELNYTCYTQPALFALEYALAQLWLHWGVKPALVMGHSVGEYVAACIAGVFSLEDGLKLIAHRGRLMQALPDNGAMMAVMADEKTVLEVIVPYSHTVGVAAINGTSNTVISGEKETIGAIELICQNHGIKTKKLSVSHAFHSVLMKPMLEDFARLAREITYYPPQIEIISNVTGTVIADEISTADYWCEHILAPVRFAESMFSLSRKKTNIFLEIGPKPILIGMGRGCLPDTPSLWLASMQTEKDDQQQLLESLALLYTKGVPVKLDRPIVPLALPTYPFQGQSYWYGRSTVATSLPSPPTLPKSTPVFSVTSVAISREKLLSSKDEDKEPLLQAYLSGLLKKVTGNPTNALDEQQKLAYLGIDSLMSVEIRKHLETDLKIAVPVEYFAQLTIAQFRQQVLLLLQGQESSSAITSDILEELTSPWFPSLNPQSTAQGRLFCFPHAGAGAAAYQSWPSLFPPEIEICPIQLPGRETRLNETAFTRLQPLIVSLTEAIAPYLDRPFAFFGHSFGALLAFELTRHFRRQGLPQPFHLFLSARRAPQLPDHEAPIHNLSEDRFFEALKRWRGIPPSVLQDRDFTRLYQAPLRADFAALETYFYPKDKPVDCRISCFGGIDDTTVKQIELEAWQEQTSQKINLKLFAGDHFFLENQQQEISSIIINEFNFVRSN